MVFKCNTQLVNTDDIACDVVDAVVAFIHRATPLLQPDQLATFVILLFFLLVDTTSVHLVTIFTYANVHKLRVVLIHRVGLVRPPKALITFGMIRYQSEVCIHVNWHAIVSIHHATCRVRLMVRNPLDIHG